MSREIKIHKFEDNTSWSVHVIDSYGKEHHLGYWRNLENHDLIYAKASYIWANEVKPKKDLLGNAIKECIQSDKNRGVKPNLD